MGLGQRRVPLAELGAEAIRIGVSTEDAVEAAETRFAPIGRWLVCAGPPRDHPGAIASVTVPRHSPKPIEA
jgi:hypothetical protein